MKRFLTVLGLCCCISLSVSSAQAEPRPKVMALDFQLNDMTDIPNAPEELERIALLSSAFHEKLAEKGIDLVPPNAAITAAMASQSATYLYNNVENAARLAEGSGADYLLIGVALKPTYLFVYPRVLLVDIKTHQVLMSKSSQLESSWTDRNTTIRTAANLAQVVKDRLMKLDNMH